MRAPPSPEHFTCAHAAPARARTDPVNAPVSRHPNTHTVAPRHALPILPLLGSLRIDQNLPACSSCRRWFFLSNFTPKSPATGHRHGRPPRRREQVCAARASEASSERNSARPAISCRSEQRAQPR
eukprot:318824-Prymnesium_polylepis.1